MSTQPISALERNVTIIAVVLGLLLFALLGKTCIQKRCHEPVATVADADTSASHANVPDQSAKIKRLETELQSARNFGDVYQAELTEARAKRKAAEDALAALKKSLASKKSITVAPAAAAAVADTSPKVDTKPFQDKIDDLKRQLVQLKADLEGKIRSKDKQIELFKRSYKQLQSDHQGCGAQITQLQNQIDALKKSGSKHLTGADKDLAKLKKEYALLQTSFNVVRKQAEKDRADLLSLRPELVRLRKALAKLRNKHLFAKSADDLAPAHTQLFARLKALEGESSDALEKAYVAVGTELKSKAATRVYFSTGSVTVKPGDISNIEEVAKNSKGTDSFLVVGYASKKGDRDVNRSLSSERATAVAKELLSKLGGKNHVQAVYLGETDRFGPAEKNQVVEIWKISR